MSNFDSVVNSYYHSWFRFHPETAVDLGVDGFSHLLRPCGDDEIGALTALNEKLLGALDEISPEELGEDQQIDYRIMRGAAMLELKELVEQDWRFRDPARFLPIHAIYQLSLRQVEDLPGAYGARLEAIPGHLRCARGQLGEEPEQIPALWLEMAITEAEQGAQFLRELHHHPVIIRYKRAPELDEAIHAVEEFARFMEKDLLPKAQGNFACGRDVFEMRLHHQHALDINVDQLHALGRRLFDETLIELKAVTRELQGNEDFHALTEKIQARSSESNNLLEQYRTGMVQARDFLLQQDLVSLPVQEQLKVVETPLFLRHEIPFAAYVEPAKNDAQQQGWYYVTPPESDADWGEHNPVSLQHTCVHEAWPGHHLQFVTANQNPASSTLPRLLNPSASLYEGWALYCEQLMQEQGFLAAPESRFILLKDRLWRALRIMLDVELHTQDLALELAADRMEQWLGFSHAQAIADLQWYTRAPTVPMGYATGWTLINTTRSRLKASEKDFNIKQFHDGLLSMGSIPVAEVIRHRFGQPLWDSVRREVF
ncbi:MAG: DUF885 domain-containing protein [Gammaproteobacteria bacterium]|nr:DUF885 domain-containing protein [Gammaproteobacteria bacterium]